MLNDIWKSRHQVYVIHLDRKQDAAEYRSTLGTAANNPASTRFEQTVL
jgi:hypothetical protein